MNGVNITNIKKSREKRNVKKLNEEEVLLIQEGEFKITGRR